MKRTFFRTTGVALIIAGIGGLIFSLTGLFMVWRFRPIVNDNLISSLQTTGDVLITTADGLVLVEESLDSTIRSLETLEDTVNATADTIDSTTPMVETLVKLTDEDLPQTLEATQLSISSAQESALIIDRFLSALSVFPGVDYNPELPLNEALDQVSVSLEDLPDSLETMEITLTTTQTNLEVIQSDIQLIAADINDIRISLGDSQEVINQYQTLVSDVEARINRAEEDLPGQLTTLAWVLTFILLWAIFSQVGLVLQGWGMLQSPVYDILDEEIPDRPVD